MALHTHGIALSQMVAFGSRAQWNSVMLPFDLTINKPWLDLVALRSTSHVKSLAREKSRESKARMAKGAPHCKHELLKGTKEYRVFVATRDDGKAMSDVCRKHERGFGDLVKRMELCRGQCAVQRGRQGHRHVHC